MLFSLECFCLVDEIAIQFDLEYETGRFLAEVSKVDVFVYSQPDRARYPQLDGLFRSRLHLTGARIFPPHKPRWREDVVSKPRMLLHIRHRYRLRCLTVHEVAKP